VSITAHRETASKQAENSILLNKYEINFDTHDKWDKLTICILLNGWFGISIG